MFYIVDLEDKADKTKQKKKLDIQTDILRDTVATEKILYYNKSTGWFRFGNLQSIPVSKTPRAKIRKTAKTLMEYWTEEKPCPKSEIIKPFPLCYPLPKWMSKEISIIRKRLASVKVDLPHCRGEEIFPPEGARKLAFYPEN